MAPDPNQPLTDPAPPDPILAKALVADGHRLTEEGDFAGAEVACRQAIAINPNLPIAHNNLGFCLQAQGDLEQAAACYRRALELDSGLMLARLNLAKTCVFLGRFDESFALVEDRLALSPASPALLDLGIEIALEAGDLERAGAYARRHVVARAASRWFPVPRAESPRVMPDKTPELSAAKLRHDIEQLRYLRARGLVGADLDTAIDRFETLLADIAPFGEDARFALEAQDAGIVADVYGRVVHHRPTPRIARAVSDRWEPAAAEDRYLSEPPGIIWVDDFLTPEALDSLRAFCLESTIWSNNRYSNGYLGSFFRDGFNCPLLLQIASELQAALPRVIGQRPLLQMWGYKYDPRLTGIATHADFASVNVNFWITPDSANLDSEGGGLVVHDVEAPLDWDFSTYNDDRFTMHELIRRTGKRSVNIPYRQNRAVIFNSDLFHATAPLNFKPGYENRRINVTMLFGSRERHLPEP